MNFRKGLSDSSDRVCFLFLRICCLAFLGWIPGTVLGTTVDLVVKNVSKAEFPVGVLKEFH
jgi:hypothetical protein